MILYCLLHKRAEQQRRKLFFSFRAASFVSMVDQDLCPKLCHAAEIKDYPAGSVRKIETNGW